MLIGRWGIGLAGERVKGCRLDSRTVIALIVLGWYGMMSVVSFVMYWRDKRAAGRGRWRISEGSLLTADLLGGWPGGWVARHVFRHKTRKASYRARFYAIVALHLCAWIAMLWWIGRGRGWW